MSKDVEQLKGATVADLKNVFRDYNAKLRKKEYKITGMKKDDLLKELKKMYSWKRNEGQKKISFLRKGKQHSYVLLLKGNKNKPMKLKKGDRKTFRPKAPKPKPKLPALPKAKAKKNKPLPKPPVPAKKKPEKNYYTMDDIEDMDPFIAMINSQVASAQYDFAMDKLNEVRKTYRPKAPKYKPELPRLPRRKKPGVKPPLPPKRKKKRKVKY